MYSTAQIPIYVDPTKYLTYYDRIQVFRSDQEKGPWTSLTASSYSPPILPLVHEAIQYPVVHDPEYQTAGTYLEVLLNETESFTFNFDIDLSGTEIIDHVYTATYGRISGFITQLPSICLQTITIGENKSLRVTGGTAADLLGFEVNDFAQGQNPHLILVDNVKKYTFQDTYSFDGAFYNFRLINLATSATSEFFGAISRDDYQNDAIQATITLKQYNGKPLRNQAVRLWATNIANVRDNILYTGTDLVRITDNDGFAVFSVVRGAVFSLSIPGTNIFRTIKIPTDVESVDLLDPSISIEDDMFKVHVPKLVAATRRSI